jgi:hypothetical protein
MYAPRLVATMHNLPSEGLRAILPLRKDIEPEASENYDPSKYVKLKFTRRQYDAFRDACNIFTAVSEHPEFNDFVQKALNADIKVRTIKTQLVSPIADAPTRIINLGLKASSSKGEQHVPKITYFTRPIAPTDACMKLYSHVAALVDGNTKYNIASDCQTCITDIRRMLSKYINASNIKSDDGTIVDDFLQKIAYKTLNKGNQALLRIDGSYVIPKGDRKIHEQIVNEIAFGS